MAVTDSNMVDGVAYDNKSKTLIMEIYDHLNFEGKFEYDHIVIFQEKFNTYLWYINSKQYKDVYPEKCFVGFLINVHFYHKITSNCRKYIDESNKKLSSLNIQIIPYMTTG